MNASFLRGRMGYLVTSTAVVGVLAISSTAFAQTATPSAPPGEGMMHGRGMWGGKAPGVFGKVSAISGAILTITETNPRNNTTTTYSVDGTNATVTKAGAASSIGAIAVGDTVMAQGTVNGTLVVATTIRDGMMGRMGMGKGNGWGPNASSSIIKGNGQPVIGGAVTAVNGTTLTVTNKSNVTYTVDATSATIEKAGAASTVASISVGDNVIVQGTVNGSSVSASSVMDSGAMPTPGAAPTIGMQGHRGMGGFFGGIAGFFHSLFGFF